MSASSGGSGGGDSRDVVSDGLLLLEEGEQRRAFILEAILALQRHGSPGFVNWAPWVDGFYLSNNKPFVIN